MATDGWGIDDGWWGVDGTWHPATDATRAAVRRAMAPGGSEGGEVPPGRPTWIVRPGAREPLASPCDLRLEDGTDLAVGRELPPDLPLGIHDLVPRDGGPTTNLVVSPGRAHLPADLRTWGVTVQVPSLRSAGSWGIGDLADVATVAGWLAGRGAGAVALSPLHAPQPVGVPADSPYYPSSRRWRSPLLLRVEDVPGAAALPQLTELAREGRALAEGARIDRAAAWRLKLEALEALWRSRPGHDPAFEAWSRAQGASLWRWSTFAAVAERHGPAWRSWPEALRHPDGPAVRRLADELADRRAFHAWLQFEIEAQLSRAAAGGPALVQDLAVGVDPAGADAWAWQDLLALDVRVGAPPDAFATAGQDWGLPPFVPWALRDVGYRPLAELFGSAMATGGLRVDHVMGLSRLYWIPAGASPAEGTYVHHAPGELIEVLAMESARRGALVVGEDLGTVEPELRARLEAAGVLSTRLVWFEPGAPESFPHAAMAAVTTHDLPTIAGAWTGADGAELDALGRHRDARAAEGLRDRLVELTGLDPATTPAREVAVAVHDHLGRSPSVLAMATLEDCCAVERRPNVPGTVTERPNWSLPLPLTVEEMATDPGVDAVLGALAAGRRATDPPGARSGT
ncbi:MAG: 4-alpha-glucanotransferase [Acidimicrobiia bacterium]